MKMSFGVVALFAALLVVHSQVRAADSGFPIYFENSKLIVKAESVNRTTYLPLLDIVQFMKLSYTDAVTLETFTIRSGNSRLVLTKNSGLISINDQIVILRNPIMRENDRWLVPIDFFTLGLSRITGQEFRYRTGMSRMFVGNNTAPELVMNAQSLGPITRLTLRVGTAATVSLNRSEPRRTVILIDRNPLDPLREEVDQRDRLIRSIAYDDSDGTSKIIVETTDEVADARVTPAEGNEIFFVDFMRKGTPAPPEPPPPVEPPPGAKTDAPSAAAPHPKLRVVVLDPGHGGLDAGTKSSTVAEKDLTLSIARHVRAALQTRLGVTVLLTRDADVEMANEARTAVANNNQANLFISLHIGYSANRMDSSSSIFLMKEDFGGPGPQFARDRMFLPWFQGYRKSQPASHEIAKLVQDELTKGIPSSQFAIRSAPLGVLSSTTMPCLAIEIGNLNNSVNAQTLMDEEFQNRVANAIVSAVQRFGDAQAPSPQAQ
jgi:N-acetylmuramoyl-L-alanine amidase